MGNEDLIHWQKILNTRGWMAPNWPVEYGGIGWTLTQKYIAAQEFARLKTRAVRDGDDYVINGHKVPYTLTGKKLEVPVKKLLMGVAVDKALNRGAIANPLAMNYFIKLAEKLQNEDASRYLGVTGTIIDDEADANTAASCTRLSRAARIYL